MAVYLGSNRVCTQGGTKNITGGISLQSKTVSPSESSQTVTADSGYDGLSQVTVNEVSYTNLYVWEKYSISNVITETEVTDEIIMYKATIGTNQNWTYVKYSDSISVENNNFVLMEPTTTFSDPNELQATYGKYIYSDNQKKYYRIPSDATFKSHSGLNNLDWYVDKAYKLSIVGSEYTKNDFIENVTSKNSDKYPTNGIKDGYWYVYVGILSDTKIGGIDTSDATATASDIAINKTAYVNGNKITGTHSCSSGSSPTLQSKSVSPSESSQTVKPDSGYDGLSQVTVSAISNTYVGSGVTKKSAATYTPTTSDQTIASGQYLNGAQTIKGDSNLVASNIKSGVSIFGVSGSYTASSSGTDTSDATATASDILSGKTAYVKGSKITGTITSQAAQTITPGTSDKTIASGKYLSGTQTIKGDANLVASNIKSGVSIFGVAGSYTGSGGSGSSTNNCEAYHITSTSATINFQGSGTVKVFGYGAKKSTYMTTIYSFVGDGYYAGTSYGTPSKTTASFSVSGGTLSGLPSGLTAVDLLVVIGV